MPELPPTDTPDIAAVFVSYHCTEALLLNVTEILKQVAFVVVVDNGSSESSAGTLQAIERLDRVSLVRLGVNAGIARALNVAMQAAADRGCEWVLTMDQDSRPGENLARGLLADLGHYSEPVAIVAPMMIDAAEGTIIQGWVPPPELAGKACPIDVCMTSGALTNTRIWAQAGGFNEPYFIDYVDHEFCLRCHDVGALVLQSFNASIYHHLGQREPHRLGRWKYYATHHSAWRRYFITRNRLHLWGAFWRRHRPYILKDMKAMLFETVKILAVEDHKLAKLGAMARGIAHAVTGKPNLNRK
jgi:rhamnosyltransferase